MKLLLSQDKIIMSGEYCTSYLFSCLLDFLFSTCLLELWLKTFTDAELSRKEKKEQ